MKKPKQLSPKDAVAAFDRGAVLDMPIRDVMRFLGLTPEEFLPYLQRGDITAHERDGGMIVIRSDELIEFMVNHGLPRPYKSTRRH